MRPIHREGARWLVFLALLAPLPAAAQAPPEATLPRGWRPVLQADLGADADHRNPKDVDARGDFDGDGRLDRARILVRASAPGSRGLFVFLNLGQGRQRHVQLQACPAGCPDHVLTVVSPGCYHEAMADVRVCLRHAGLAEMDAEFGTGTLHWLERGRWKTLPFGRATLNGLPR